MGFAKKKKKNDDITTGRYRKPKNLRFPQKITERGEKNRKKQEENLKGYDEER